MVTWFCFNFYFIHLFMYLFIYVKVRPHFFLLLWCLFFYYLYLLFSWPNTGGGAKTSYSRCGLWRHSELQMVWKPPSHSHLDQKRHQHGENKNSTPIFQHYFPENILYIFSKVVYYILMELKLYCFSVIVKQFME